MRIRNVKGASEAVHNHGKVVNKPEKHLGKWQEVFGNDNPIYIEIGMGKGEFLLTHAKNNKDINYIGIEYMTNVLFKALDKVNEYEDLENFRLIRMNAEHILDVFAENEIDRLYLNFSDPWPKERHTKKRLTNRKLLSKYNIVLKNGSKIIFKTDNEPLFEYSVYEMQDYGFKLNIVTRDLHNSHYAFANVMTEYEKKFIAKDMNICMLEAITRNEVKDESQVNL